MLPYIGDIAPTDEIENVVAHNTMTTLEIAPQDVKLPSQEIAGISEDMLNIEDASSDSVSANSDA